MTSNDANPKLMGAIEEADEESGVALPEIKMKPKLDSKLQREFLDFIEKPSPKKETIDHAKLVEEYKREKELEEGPEQKEVLTDDDDTDQIHDEVVEEKLQTITQNFVESARDESSTDKNIKAKLNLVEI